MVTKFFYFILGVLVSFCVAAIFYNYYINGDIIITKSERKPWKPKKDYYNIGEEINYGPALFKIISFEKLHYSSAEKHVDLFTFKPYTVKTGKELYILKVFIKNSYTKYKPYFYKRTTVLD